MGDAIEEERSKVQIVDQVVLAAERRECSTCTGLMARTSESHSRVMICLYKHW